MNEDLRDGHRPWWGSPMKLALIGFSLIGGFFLIAEHRAHVLPYLPFLLLAACPLLHLFGHGAHGHGARADDQHDAPRDRVERGTEGSSATSADHRHHHGEGQS